VNEATNSFLTIFDNEKVLSGNEGISINDLKRLEMKNLNIMSCNTGHLNHKDIVYTWNKDKTDIVVSTAYVGDRIQLKYPMCDGID
jgi:hypothetical protein